jgi:hypothetical protein
VTAHKAGAAGYMMTLKKQMSATIHMLPGDFFFLEGQAACADGRDIQDNPYPPYSDQYCKRRERWLAVGFRRRRVRADLIACLVATVENAAKEDV